MNEDNSANHLRLQIERIENELCELNKYLEDGALYRPPTVLYHTPQEVPGFSKLLTHLKEFEPRLKACLQQKFTKR
jgi:hypothetical protein